MSWKSLTNDVISCRLCPRLVTYREKVPAKKCYCEESYWRKPVPGFGDKDAWLLILGLAPSPHGGNRTGRIFTGDQSSEFLFKMLHKEGFSNLSVSEHRHDGLELIGCYLTAAVKCVPPEHKPTKLERFRCSQYYFREIALLKNLRCILTLGELALESVRFFARQNKISASMKLEHGASYHIQGLPVIYTTYHPSPQNTYTGKLTDKMFSSLLKKIKREQAP
jgi:uracil-DNA glycosylase